MDNENDKTMEMMQIPESQIVMTDKGPDIQAVPRSKDANSEGARTVKAVDLDRPHIAPDPADQSDSSQNELKSMADKSAICMMRRVQLAIDGEDWPTLDRLMPHLMKLLDAQMAMEWSIKWQRHILEKPQNLTALKAQSSLTAINQGRAVKANKQQKGDGRTTPKRLLKDLPSDEVA